MLLSPQSRFVQQASGNIAIFAFRNSEMSIYYLRIQAILDNKISRIIPQSLLLSTSTHEINIFLMLYHRIGLLFVPIGSLWVPIGSLWVPIGSLWVPIGPLWVPIGPEPSRAEPRRV